jgi:hypothetical protein
MSEAISLRGRVPRGKARRGHTGGAEVLRLTEPSLLQDVEEIPNRDRAAHSFGPRLEAVSDLGWEILLQDDVGELEAAAGCEDPVDLAEGLIFRARDSTHRWR